jgi:cholesterol oxidase
MADEFDYDVVVVGSGFGGAVTAYRLAAAEYTVLVLERGQRWGPNKGRRDEVAETGDERDEEVVNFPRTAKDAWFWDHKHPEQSHGWLDFRNFPYMGVILGSGVGGGSLIYANVSIEADKESFDKGWPAEITLGTLKPYYDKVTTMLELDRVPPGQWSERVKLMSEGAKNNDREKRFQPVDVAVRFDRDLKYESSQRPDPRSSRRGQNLSGAWQGTCAQLGNCDIGCDVGAKNTLDKNYLFRAERQHGAKIWPRRLVRCIAPEGAGYRVHFDEIVRGGFKPGSVSGRLVIIAAGSLGSTELLLRCKEQYRTLPEVSDCLGKNWSSNGDFLTPAFHFFRKTPYPGRGITIAGSITFLDGHPDDLGKEHEKRRKFIIEDGGFPYQAAGAIIGALIRNRAHKVGLRHTLLHALGRLVAAGYDALHWISRLPFLKLLKPVFEWLDPINHVMPWFAQGKDAANGTLSLKDGELSLEWPWLDSKEVIDAIYDTHRKLAYSTKGWVVLAPPITWTVFHSLITPHPLGGCNMGSDATSGVVNHKGEVFAYSRLYVADGAIVPEALGINPSKTIAALAERIAENIIADHPLSALRS